VFVYIDDSITNSCQHNWYFRTHYINCYELRSTKNFTWTIKQSL